MKQSDIERELGTRRGYLREGEQVGIPGEDACAKS